MTDRGGPQPIPRPALWKPGRPAPWSDSVSRAYTVDDVARAFENHVPSELIRGPAIVRPPQRGRPSAVLIALYDNVNDHDDAGATMILTRRASHLRKHAGEVAFPGGAIDDTDESSWSAALREAHEEVALDPELPRPIGELDRFVTGASFSLVTPWLAQLDGEPELEAAPDEVDEIIHVSVNELLADGVYREELWTWQGELRPIHFFELEGDTMWGATALMVRRLLEVLTESDAS